LKYLAASLLVTCYLALGTGALERLHDLEHDVQDARIDAWAKAAHLPVLPHHHDESNCEIHAQLHMAIIFAGWVPLLVLLGLFIAFLTLLDTPLIPRLLPVRIDCRGPPARLVSIA
jgi:hypothetical protein